MTITLPALFPILPATSILAWTVAGYVLFLVVYRCFLSPLAKIPGPRLAALTYWYECYYDVIQPAQYAFKVKEMHARYGPIIRIGPNDVSVSDPDFVDAIYAPGPGRKRDKDYEQNKALGVDSSIGGAIPHELHRKRREALNPFFSPQRISRSLDPKLRDKVSQLDDIFGKAKERGEVLNLSDIYFAFANDIVHEYCFTNSPNLLADLPLANIRRTNVAAVLSSVKVMRHFSWIRHLTQMFPASIGSRITPRGVRDMITFRKDIRTQIDNILAAGSSDETPSSIFTHLRDSPLLPPSEKTAQRLEDEATLMVMAGTYSPMLSLVTAHYHLLARRDIMAKLRAELAANFPAANMDPLSRVAAVQLQQLPYLLGIIQEAHRLTFGLTGRNARVCSDETLVYTRLEPGLGHRPGTAYTIPPGTSISAPTLTIHTDESVFPDPWSFEPERWVDRENHEREVTGEEQDPGPKTRTPATSRKQTRTKAMLSLGRGPRACIGMHLANAQMAVALVAMAHWDMRLFDTTEERDVKFCHDYHVLSPRLGSKGVRAEVVGRWDGTG